MSEIDFSMRKYLIFLVLTLLAMPSCMNSEKVSKPEVFLEEQQMIDVLFDSYLIEAELNQMKSEGKDVSSLQRVYYEQLFEHYSITDSIFEQNMYYYTHHPAILERMMDSVSNRFLKKKN
jgi:hypothetical protein